MTKSTKVWMVRSPDAAFNFEGRDVRVVSATFWPGYGANGEWTICFEEHVG